MAEQAEGCHIAVTILSLACIRLANSFQLEDAVENERKGRPDNRPPDGGDSEPETVLQWEGARRNSSSPTVPSASEAKT